MNGTRHNNGKARLDLIPPQALWELGMLYTEGAKKYPSDRNWEEGLPYSTYIAAIHRHLIKFQCGEEHDMETNIHHLIAIAWNAIGLYMTHTWVKLKKLTTDLDDRGNNDKDDFFWMVNHFKPRPTRTQK